MRSHSLLVLLHRPSIARSSFRGGSMRVKPVSFDLRAGRAASPSVRSSPRLCRCVLCCVWLHSCWSCGVVRGTGPAVGLRSIDRLDKRKTAAGGEARRDHARPASTRCSPCPVGAVLHEGMARRHRRPSARSSVSTRPRVFGVGVAAVSHSDDPIGRMTWQDREGTTTREMESGGTSTHGESCCEATLRICFVIASRISPLTVSRCIWASRVLDYRTTDRSNAMRSVQQRCKVVFKSSCMI
jgi:hypothetical protein